MKVTRLIHKIGLQCIHWKILFIIATILLCISLSTNYDNIDLFYNDVIIAFILISIIFIFGWIKWIGYDCKYIIIPLLWYTDDIFRTGNEQTIERYEIWCKNNLNKKWWYCSCGYFTFQCLDDAVAFKIYCLK